MIRTLVYFAAFTLTITSFSPTAYGDILAEAERLPYITGAVAFPSRSRPSIASHVRHTIRLKIPQESSALLQIVIDVPDGLTVRNDINVFDQSERKVNANTSVNGSQVIIAFPTPVVPGTKLNIGMNDVIVLGVSNAWLYQVRVKLANINIELPLGVAQIRVY